MDDEDDVKAIEKLKQAKQKYTFKKPQPLNKDTDQTVPSKTEAILPNGKKTPDIKDSAR